MQTHTHTHTHTFAFMNVIDGSSDFCHWGSRFHFQSHDRSKGQVHEYISWLDHAGMEIIESQDPDAFAKYLDETNNTICGRYPILVSVCLDIWVCILLGE